MTAILQVFSANFASKLLMASGLLLLIGFMPTSEWAAYTFAYAIVCIAAPILTAMVNMVFIVGKGERSRGDATRFFAFQLWTCLLLIGLSLTAWPWYADLLLAAACLNFAQCMSEFVKTIYQQREHFTRMSLVEFARAGLFVIGLAGLIAVRGDGIAASTVLYIQALTALPIVLPMAFATIDWRALTRFADSFSLLRDFAGPKFRFLTGYFILLTVLGQSTIFLIEALGTDADLANFGTAYRFHALLMLALNAVLVVQLPAVAKATDPAGVRSVLRQNQRLVPPFTVLIAIGALAAPWLMPMIDGGKYPQAPALFQILSVSAALSFALSPYSNVAKRACDFRYMFLALLVITPASLLGCVLLFQIGGTYGMAVGYSATYFANNFAMFLRSKKLLRDEEAAEQPSEVRRMAA